MKTKQDGKIIVLLIFFIAVTIFGIVLQVFNTYTIFNQDWKKEVTIITEREPPIIRYMVRLEINIEVWNVLETGNMDRVNNFYNKYIQNSVLTFNIITNCIRYEVPIHIAMSVSWLEAGFNPNAINENKNDKGIVLSTDVGAFQLNTLTFPDHTIDELKEIPRNCKLGIEYLAEKLKEFKLWHPALSAYHISKPETRPKDIVIKGCRYATLIESKEREYDMLFNKEF